MCCCSSDATDVSIPPNQPTNSSSLCKIVYSPPCDCILPSHLLTLLSLENRWLIRLRFLSKKCCEPVWCCCSSLSIRHMHRVTVVLLVYLGWHDFFSSCLDMVLSAIYYKLRSPCPVPSPLPWPYVTSLCFYLLFTHKLIKDCTLWALVSVLLPRF